MLRNLGEPGGLDITPWTDRDHLIDATFAGARELPVLGQVAAPAAVLSGPDGSIAWVGDRANTGLRDTLTTRCGAP